MNKDSIIHDDTIKNFHIPRWNELPTLDLYMDQVIALIDTTLGAFFSEIGAASLTKNMVNNYVKAKIVDAPVNKKYPKLSVAMIIVVYILKNCYATDEIGKLTDQQELMSAIHQLPTTFREVILLHYYQGYGITEIAEMMNLPEGTISSRLSRGRKKLDSILKEGDAR